jgi:glycosyltransferase involved in cell wall biosynthesis
MMKSNNPRVSIGLPVFNGERYLEPTLDAILGQTYSDFELIISDNASTDRTPEICQTYAAKDQRIRYYRNEKNLGAAPNHNHVFQLSAGEYFKWSGYDDLIKPDFLARCVEILDQNPAVIVCMPKPTLIDKQGVYLGKYEHEVDGSAPKPHHRFRDFLHNEKGDLVYGLMRASVIRQTGLHGSYPSSDLVFLAELSLYGPFYIVPDRLFLRRIHSEQSTQGALQVERDRVAWFDTSLQDKISLPKWEYFFGYLKAITNAPLSRYERAYCYAQMVRWVLKPPHFRAMGKEVLLAVNKSIVRTFFKPKVKIQHAVGETEKMY